VKICDLPIYRYNGIWHLIYQVKSAVDNSTRYIGKYITISEIYTIEALKGTVSSDFDLSFLHLSVWVRALTIGIKAFCPQILNCREILPQTWI